MKGYKVFNPNWTCRDFKYEVGKIYEIDEYPIICKLGFHFCQKLANCFNYYEFNPHNKVAEIEALGQIEMRDIKSCTNKIKIVRELSWSEVLELVNTGNYNSGYNNFGDYNTGNYNTGNYNSGKFNSGKFNSGYHNSGNYNSGNYNSGNYNSGDNNSGKFNSGYHNSGYHNSGNYNSGHCNSGNFNSGDFNSGDWNKIHFSSGIFNDLEEKNIRMFNKPSKWTYGDWNNSEAKKILKRIPMKESNKEELNKVRQKWWNALSDIEKKSILSLPNFDKEIFKNITGIKVTLIEENKK